MSMTVKRFNPDGSEQQVPMEKLRIGDVVERNGKKVRLAVATETTELETVAMGVFLWKDKWHVASSRAQETFYAAVAPSDAPFGEKCEGWKIPEFPNQFVHMLTYQEVPDS